MVSRREALDRSASLLSHSEPGSPMGSIGTIHSVSTTSVSGSGSASTVFVLPLHTIPSLLDLHTFSDSLSTGLLSHGLSFPPHHTHTTDDGAVSNRSYLYPVIHMSLHLVEAVLCAAQVRLLILMRSLPPQSVKREMRSQVPDLA